METYIVDNGVRVTQRSHVTHSADGLRTVNQNPIAYEAGTTNEFKDTATINM